MLEPRPTLSLRALMLSVVVHLAVAVVVVLIGSAIAGRGGAAASSDVSGGPVWISLIKDDRANSAPHRTLAPTPTPTDPAAITRAANTKPARSKVTRVVRAESVPVEPRTPVAVERTVPPPRPAIEEAESTFQPVEPSPAAPASLSSESPLELAVAESAPGRAPSVGQSSGRPGAVLAARTAPDWPGSDEVDRAAAPRWPIRPEYPPHARRRGEESTVVVQAWVDESGDVAFSSVLESGGEDFDESARRAVQRSVFSPARLAGRRVASRVNLRIHFQLLR